MSIFNLLRKSLNAIRTLIPYKLRQILDPETYGIVKFMKFASAEITPGSKILDAGAGTSPYKVYFSHTIYESTDFENIFEKSPDINHTFTCSLDNIPCEDNSYDAIINTQVLEHVEYPQKVIKEFYRILKPGGKLFLTTPQGWGLHGEPYHFFNFTIYGLQSLFNNAKFEINYIKPKGGIFWYLSNRISTLPQYILLQYLFKTSDNKITFQPSIWLIFILPITIIFYPICTFVLPLTFFYLDIIDRRQSFTLGYTCYCTKKAVH